MTSARTSPLLLRCRVTNFASSPRRFESKFSRTYKVVRIIVLSAKTKTYHCALEIFGSAGNGNNYDNE